MKKVQMNVNGSVDKPKKQKQKQKKKQQQPLEQLAKVVKCLKT